MPVALFARPAISPAPAVSFESSLFLPPPPKTLKTPDLVKSFFGLDCTWAAAVSVVLIEPPRFTPTTLAGAFTLFGATSAVLP